MRLITICFLLTILTATAEGQDIKGFKYYDSLTYTLYLGERWKEVSSVSTEAINEGHDYYYLRMRAGIALYERSFYAAAIRHFRKALEYSANDPVAVEYLYYCKLKMGEYAFATKALEQLDEKQQNRIVDESGLAHNTIWLSFYYNDFDTDEILADPADWFVNTEAGTILVSRMIANPSVSMSHYLSPGLYYSHSFNNITKISLLNYFDGTRLVNLDNHKVIQNQYYGNLVVATAGGISFSPYAHLALVMYDYILTGGTSSPGLYYVQRANAFHYSVGMSLRKRTGYFAVDGGVSLNSFGFGRVAQGEAGVMLYPFGNRWFYTGGRVSGALQTGEPLDSVTPIFTLLSGFSFPGIVSCELSVISGDLRNMTTSNGAYLFNSPDYITNRVLLNLNIPLDIGSGFTLFSGVGFNRHSSTRYTLGNDITEDNVIYYKSFNINGGLQWNF